ncbi:mannosyl-glycoprotein endo-beta-N-acetylglucosamidase [Limosilactobacillus reuteri]|uniref:Mannosyl-glycoprotein endo-beta-N-acetylglucosamidase n=1 Tax=Limosilactobacillus reuteri TaxID=1598 RepID=A0A2S1ESD5_LIMRT|nr:mannosyl-glycoprotein endo-beta-N-acetylglucosamidase [Limosilactobacillus reuteri]
MAITIAALMAMGVASTANADNATTADATDTTDTNHTVQAANNLTTNGRVNTVTNDNVITTYDSAQTQNISTMKIQSEKADIKSNAQQLLTSDQSLPTPVAVQSSTVKNGWKNEDNQWVYYVNGRPAEGRTYSYLPTINGTGNNWYLVDNGVAQSGVQQWAGTYYYFDSVTHLKVTNNYVKSQWGDWYMFSGDGSIASRVYQWAGTYYYFDPITYLRVDNDYRQSQWGDWYMFGSDGRIASQVYQWAGTYYYFDPTTYLRVNNDYRQSQWGDWYMFGSDGRIISGFCS